MDLNTKKLLEELKNSPIYAMSLGSKELFHTNVWEWMINKDSSIAGVFFDELKQVNQKLVLKREYYHLDLVIICEETQSYYVIENKTKSLPNQKQLHEYDDKINTKHKWFHVKGKLLTSLLEPDFELNEWRYLSYQEIHIKLVEAIKESPVFNNPMSKDDLIIANRYCSDLKKINEVISTYMENSLEILDYKYEDMLFREIRLHDVFLKLKADHFKNYITNHLDLDTHINEFYLEIGTDFSHGEPIIDIRYKSDNLQIGIQIQAYRYSRCVHKSGAYDMNQLFKELSEQNQWLDQHYHSARKKPYLVYDGREVYTFIYQPNEIDVNYRDYASIFSRIKADMQIAKLLIVNHQV